jgi:hypothetical protein
VTYLVFEAKVCTSTLAVPIAATVLYNVIETFTALLAILKIKQISVIDDIEADNREVSFTSDCTVGRAQNNLRTDDSGSGKAGSGHFLLQGEDSRFCWLCTGPLFALVRGCQETGIFRQGTRSYKHHSYTFTSHNKFYSDYRNCDAADQDP